MPLRSFYHDQNPQAQGIRQTGHGVIIKGQNESGGWAYGYEGPVAHTDLSVTGWNIQALKAAALTGISIDGLDEAMDKAIAYAKRSKDKSGKFAYKEGTNGKPSLTGAGVLCLQIWKMRSPRKPPKAWIGSLPTKPRNGTPSILMNGTITRKPAFRQPAFPVEPSIGGHGTKIFSKSFAELRLPTGIGRTESIFMETRTFTARP